MIMIQAILSFLKQVGPEDWDTCYHTKTFEKTATLQEIEDWAKTYDKGYTIFDVKLGTNDKKP